MVSSAKFDLKICGCTDEEKLIKMFAKTQSDL